LSKFETSFNLDLFHAALIWLSFNVGSWNVDSLISVKFGTAIVNIVFGLPFVTYVNYSLRLGVEQACVSFKSWGTNWNLVRSTKAYFDIYSQKIKN